MRWYSYLTGYLSVIVDGQFPEKVINMALTRGIFLWDITYVDEQKIMLKVRLHAYRAFARIARKCKCRTKVTSRQGLPFEISKLKKRKILALGSIFFLLSLYILTSFVWVIEIQGTEDLTAEEVKELAAEYGLKPGVVIKEIDIDELEEKIQEGHPKLAWVGISIQGTKVTIEISEKVLIPDTEDHKVAHLVAKEAGIIEEMLVLVGTPQVNEGDKIQKGQLLISGIVYPELHLNDDGTYTPAGMPEQVRAKGIVRAKVKHSIRASCSIKETKLVYTGNETEQVLIMLGDKTLVLKGPKKVPYTKYTKNTNSKTIPSWRNVKVPVELITNTFLEQEQKITDFGYEGAYREAIKRAEKSLKKVIPQDAKLLDREVQISPTKITGIVQVEVVWECLEDVALPQNITEGNSGSQ